MSTSSPADAIVLAGPSGLLLDDLMRLTAAAHVEPVLAHDVASLHRWWGTAALLVLTDDLASLVGRAPLRRDGVVLASRRRERAALNEMAVAMGAEHVVTLPDDEAWLVDRLAVAGDGQPGGVVVPVVGCRGGAGASTLVAATAMQAVEMGLRCVVVDADPAGADLDLLDMVGEPGLRWSDLAASGGRLPAGALAAALPQRSGVALLRAGDPVALVPVVDALARAFDLVLVDMPRWLPGAGRHVLDAAQSVLLVTTGDPRGLEASRRLVGELSSTVRVLTLVVRAGRAGIHGDEVAVQVGVDEVVHLRHDRRVAIDAAAGDLVMRASLRRVARRLLMGLAAGGAGHR